MTFAIIGSARAPGIADARPTAEPDIIRKDTVAVDLLSLFGLDRSPVGTRLGCRWRRERDGRLACVWEPDIVLKPQH
jgi:hypothetical protein